MVRNSNNNTEGFERLLKNIHLNSFMYNFCLLKLANSYLKDAVFLEI